MAGFFNVDNPVWRFIGKFADIILLNILWLICSIPIVTIGPATTAVYYVTLKLARDEEGYTVKSFFKSFRENLKQGIIIWLIMLIIGGVLYFDLRVYINLEAGTFQKVMAMIFMGVAILYTLTLFYVFPLLARFNNTIKGTLKNALFISVRHLPKSIMMILMNVIIAAVCILVFPPLMFFGLPLLAFLNSFLFVGIFDCYMPENLHRKDKELSELNFDESEEQVPEK